MHESPMADAVREVLGPGAVLEECRSKNWNMWIVLDPGCHPQALAELYASGEHMTAIAPHAPGILQLLPNQFYRTSHTENAS